MEFGPEHLSPGDVLICNDPYRGGRHVNDVLFTRPVFVDGRIVSFVNMVAHQLDMGGVVPGGFSATKRNVYENGLVLPPMLMWHEDEPVRSTFSLIFDNTRLGGLLLPDFKSMLQQLELGGAAGPRGHRALRPRRLPRHTPLRRRHVGGAHAGGHRAGPRRRLRRPLADRRRRPRRHDRVPDPGDRPQAGAHIEADLSGTAAQARSSINSGVLDAKTAVGVALTMLLDPQIPFTSGTWRYIDVATPPGTVVSALPPRARR